MMIYSHYNRFTYHMLLSVCLHVAAIIGLGVIFKVSHDDVSLPAAAKQSEMRAYLYEAPILPVARYVHAVSPVKKQVIGLEMRKASQKKMAKPENDLAPMLRPKQAIAAHARDNQKQGEGDGQHMVDALLALLHAAIQEKQQYPHSALQMGREGRVTLAFVLHKNGAISNLRIAKRSGTASLDQAAIEAVNAAAPFHVAKKYLDKSVELAQAYQVDVVFELTG